jgi:hypothetical protein
MGTLGFIGLGLLAALAVWLLVSPKSVYWTLHAWTHRNPEANEPSDAAYAFWRVGAGLALVIFVGMGWWLASAAIEDGQRAASVRDCETELLPALRDDVPAVDPTDADMQRFADENDLTIDSLSVGPSAGSDEEGISLSVYTFSDADRDVIRATRNDDGSLELTCLGG